VLEGGDLDRNYKIVANIHTDLASAATLLRVACEDGAAPLHRTRVKPEMERQAQRQRKEIHVRGSSKKMRWINLCALVCPVDCCMQSRCLAIVTEGTHPMSWKQGAGPQRPVAPHV